VFYARISRALCGLQREVTLTVADVAVHVALTIPGLFFEVVMPFWLIFKGFKPEVYR
jgi:hypothetical protein